MYFDANSFLTPDVIVPSGWLEHGPFAMWFVSKLQPDTYVELGTHNGYSYFSIAQSVKRNNLSTRMFAIDTWEGDPHAGFYGDEIYQSVEKTNQLNYSSFSTLLKMKFEDGLGHFNDSSINLIHIDGLHTYEAVKLDFETWLPKLSDDSIVLFHDIAVQENGFGVFKFWEEISSQYPSFEFRHGHGLGILKTGNKPTSVDFLFDCDDAERLEIQSFYSTLGRRVILEWSIENLKSYVEDLSQHSKNELTAVQNELTAVQNELTFAQQSLNEHSFQLAVTQKRLQESFTDIAVIQSSLSWKITKPLRQVHQKLFRQ
jgi:hypothetical protein